MSPPGSDEDLKNYIYLREIPKARFIDFGLLYENDKGEYVMLNDVRMADIRFACLLALFTLARIACLLHICDKTSRFALLYLGPRPENNLKYFSLSRTMPVLSGSRMVTTTIFHNTCMFI